VTERFSTEWLALREPFDHAARSRTLARRFVRLLPPRPRVMDLGAGTGSLFRFLAPIIGRGQDWLLIDADEALLDEAFGRTSAWARRRGWAATAEGDELRVSTPQGLWRMQVAMGDLHHVLLPCLPRVGAKRSDEVGLAVNAVTCSALLDLVSAAWLDRLCGALRVPLLASLNVDGRDLWRPRHRYDALVLTAFRRDMRRDKGFGHALGTDASRLLARRPRMVSAPSDWRIPRTALAMQRALIDGTADAARNARPAYAAAIGEWQRARLRQALLGRLAITVGHRDILLLPPGG
jgi:SAM-dependent methyltransferase